MSEPQLPSGPWGEPGAWGPNTVPAVEQPSSIRTAVRLMWVGAALAAFGVVTIFFQTDAIRDAIEDSDSSADMTADEIDTLVNVSIAAAVFFGVIGVGLWIWMAITNGQGKSWARVVATVLGGLNVLFTLLGFAGATGEGTTALGTALSLIGLALAVSILILLYRPDSTRFYEAHQPR
jgi:hypothetical protein